MITLGAIIHDALSFQDLMEDYWNKQGIFSDSYENNSHLNQDIRTMRLKEIRQQRIDIKEYKEGK